MKTTIYVSDCVLTFDGNEKLATIEEYELADRCVGSVFEALNPGEWVVLKEGAFELDEDLDLIK